jgi:hypothetical protein
MIRLSTEKFIFVYLWTTMTSAKQISVIAKFSIGAATRLSISTVLFLNYRNLTTLNHTKPTKINKIRGRTQVPTSFLIIFFQFIHVFVFALT